MKEQWRQQMQQKLADYSQPAPEVSWAEIEKAVASRKRRARVLPLWSRRVAAAAGILLLAGAGYWAVFSQRSAEPVPTAEARQVSAAPPAKAAVAQPEPPKSPVQRLLRQVGAANPLPPRQLQAQSSPQYAPADEQEPAVAAPQAADTIATTGQEQPRQRQASAYAPTYQTPYQDTHRRQAAAPDSRLTARLYLSNSTAGGGYSLLAGEDSGIRPPGKDYGTPANSQTNDGNTNDKDSQDTSPTNGDPEPGDRVRHHQPVRIGLQLRYQLTDRWSLESGLTYTRLVADLTTTHKEPMESEQSQTYIGIPLQASYQLCHGRHAGLYASAGALIEKMVDGKLTSLEGSKRVAGSPFQLSLNGAVGAEYRFTPRLSIFAEPGMSYYFDNGSSIPTPYQDTPLIFNLNLGLRFGLR